MPFAIDIVNDSGMSDCATISFPFPKGVKLSTYERDIMEDPEPYGRLIGRLL